MVVGGGFNRNDVEKLFTNNFYQNILITSKKIKTIMLPINEMNPHIKEYIIALFLFRRILVSHWDKMYRVSGLMRRAKEK